MSLKLTLTHEIKDFDLSPGVTKKVLVLKPVGSLESDTAGLVSEKFEKLKDTETFDHTIIDATEIDGAASAGAGMIHHLFSSSNNVTDTIEWRKANTGKSEKTPTDFVNIIHRVICINITNEQVKRAIQMSWVAKRGITCVDTYEEAIETIKTGIHNS